MNNPIDYLKIAVITWAACFAFNRALKAAGLSQFAATKASQAS
jgi:hypothetical protein